MENTKLAVWFFIAGSYMMTLFVGFSVGFLIRWWKSEKLVRKDVYVNLAKGNPYYTEVLKSYKELHKRQRK